jgi:hypothetical protein
VPKTPAASDLSDLRKAPATSRAQAEALAKLSPQQLIERSDEIDGYERRILAARREGYAAGLRDGRAAASVWNAELFSDEQADQQWRDWVRNLSLDRRDRALVARLKAKRARYAEHRRREDQLDHYEHVILYFAESPNLTLRADPGMRPHGQAR